MNSQVLKLGQETIFYVIAYSNRKTLAIRMSEEGELEVRAPRRMKQIEIEHFLVEKQEWILKHKQKSKIKNEKKPLFEWKNGAIIPIAGKNYVLVVKLVRGSTKNIVKLQEETILMTTPDDSIENVKQVVTLWFKKACKPLIEYRMNYFADCMGVTYERVTLKEQKRCWGSCSSKDNINLNWKLLLMPPEIMDYVIVHELAHLLEMNHSPIFWGIVQSEIQDYKIRKQWLKDNGYSYIRM